MTVYLIYIFIHLLMLLAAIGFSSVSIAFPNITQEFHSSVILTGWVLSIYLLVSTAASVLVGKVSEILGKKRTFLICTILFTLGSLLSAVAPNVQLLIFFRFIQSIGGGGSTPAIVGIVADIFPGSRQKALGFSLGIATIGTIIGPSLAGWLVTGFGWRSIFWFNVPLGILIVVVISILLKGDRGQKSHIDFSGAAYLMGALFCIMIALSQIRSNNALWLVVGLLFLAGLIFAAIFIRHEIRTPDPVIDLDFLRRKPFVASNLYTFAYGLCTFGLASLIPLYALAVYNLDTIKVSLILTIRSVGTILFTTTSSFFVVRWGYRRPLLIGTGLMALSLILIGFEFQPFKALGVHFDQFTILCILCLIMGVGTGIASPASVNAGIDLNPQKASAISGVMGMFRQGGGALEIALVTLLLQYIGDMAMGFEIAFLGTGLVLLAVIPAIFALPRRPAAVNATAKANA
jgi:MFS family permease